MIRNVVKCPSHTEDCANLRSLHLSMMSTSLIKCHLMCTILNPRLHLSLSLSLLKSGLFVGSNHLATFPLASNPWVHQSNLYTTNCPKPWTWRQHRASKGGLPPPAHPTAKESLPEAHLVAHPLCLGHLHHLISLHPHLHHPLPVPTRHFFRTTLKVRLMSRNC